MVMHLRQIMRRASIVAFAARLSSTHSPSSNIAATAFLVPIPTTPYRGRSSRSSSSSSSSSLSTTSRLFSATTTTPPPPPSTRYLLSYDYVPDVLERRGPYREGHLGLAKAMIGEGTCVSGGPTSDPGEGVPKGGECREK